MSHVIRIILTIILLYYVYQDAGWLMTFCLTLIFLDGEIKAYWMRNANKRFKIVESQITMLPARLARVFKGVEKES